MHGEPETGSIAAGYLFNDIASAYIDSFAKIPALAPGDARRANNDDARRRSEMMRARARRDRSFSRDNVDYALYWCTLAAHIHRSGGSARESSRRGFSRVYIYMYILVTEICLVQRVRVTVTISSQVNLDTMQ